MSYRHRQEIRFDERMHKCLSRNRKPLGFPVTDALGFSECECMEYIAFSQYLKIVTMVEVHALPLRRFLYVI